MAGSLRSDAELPHARATRTEDSWVEPDRLQPCETRGLPFDSGERGPLDEGALDQEEENDDRQRHAHGHRHHQAPGGIVLLAIKVQAERDGVRLLLVQEEQRPQKILPCRQELEQRDRGERGLRQWQHQARKDAELTRAVDPTGLRELPRNRQEELPQQEDVERIAEEWRNDQRQWRADPVECSKDQEERNHRRVEG